MQVGDTVRVTDHPAHQEWMEGLLGEVGTILEVRTGEPERVRVKVALCAPVWLSTAYVEFVKVEEEQASA